MEMPRPSSAAIRMRIHDRGESARLDAILRLADLASQPRPRAELLAELCREVAGIMHAEVVSVYVRERDGDEQHLVMRGNVGFPASAIGNVRLALGEGITGFVAECLRPVSCAVAAKQASYKHVPGLGEERFPAFLALPLLSGGEAAGVLVLQRRESRAFAPSDVTLAAALTAPVAYALERAAARERHAAGEAVVHGGRAVSLSGSPLAPGAGLGRAQTLPALAGGPSTMPRAAGGRPDQVEELFEQVAGALGRLRTPLAPPLHARACALVAMLYDQRSRELAAEACSEQGLVAGLRHVVREYARVPYRLAAEDEGASWMRERAEEIEDLCVLVAAEAQSLRAPSPGGVVLLPRLSGCLALAAVARHASAVVVAGPVDPGSLGRALLVAGGVPAVADVAGVFGWVRADDRMLVDGASGAVRVNPPAADEAAFRRGG
jgi:phosphotransferase system enzyme I (PtsP)